MNCVYRILNRKVNKCYIGSTADYDRREYDHLYALRKKNHVNKYLQRAWDKYGEENFEFQVVEEYFFPTDYSKEIINEYLLCFEIHWNRYFKPEYSIAKEINRGKLGVPASKKTIENFTIKMKELAKTSDFWKKGIEAAVIKNRGQKRDKSIGQKISKIIKANGKLKGMLPSEETKQKRRETRQKTKEEKGYYCSEETRQKMSISNRKSCGKAVDVFDLDMNKIASYNTIIEAERATGVGSTSIVRQCKKKRYNGKGKPRTKLYFKYKND